MHGLVSDMHKHFPPGDFERCGYDEAARNSWKNNLVALLIGFGLGAGGFLYVHRAYVVENWERRAYVRGFDGHDALDSQKAHVPFKYFSIELDKSDSKHYVFARNKRSDGSLVEHKRAIDADAIEGLIACVERSLRYDHRADYDPPEYRALIEKLPDLDVSGNAKTITKTDVLKAYDKARGGLKAILDE